MANNTKKQAKRKGSKVSSGRRPPMRKQGGGRKPRPSPTVNQRALVATVRSVVQSQQKQMRPATMQVDPGVRRFVQSILDPWSGPLTRNPAAGGFAATAIVRRHNRFVVNLPAAAERCEVYIVLNDLRNPYVAIATKASGGSWVPPTDSNGYISGRGDKVNDINIPAGSYSRVVSAGVKLRCLSASDHVNGAVLTFPYNADQTGLQGQPGIKWGDLDKAASDAVSVHTMSRSEMRFLRPPESTFRQSPRTAAYINSAGTTIPINLDDNSSWVGGIPPEASGLGSTNGQLDFMRALVIKDSSQPISMWFEIAETIEYVHDSHVNFMEPSVNHSSGVALNESIAAFMSQRGSNQNSPTAHGKGWMQKFSKTVLGALGFVGQAASKFNSYAPYLTSAVEAFGALAL